MKKERIKKMKKKVMCMLLTGMMAASMIAGCGNSGNASANAGADTNTDASADAADSSADQSADVTPDTTAANSASAATGDFDNSEYINVVSREDGSGTRGAFIELFGVEEKNDAGEKIDNTTDEAIITNSTDVMLTTVSGDEYSIGYVSLGSLVVAWYIPANTLIMHRNDKGFIHMMVISLLFTAFAYFQHRQNIVRLIHGKENKIGSKKEL